MEDSVDEHNNYGGSRGGGGGIIAFPNLLAPPARSDRSEFADGRFMDDYTSAYVRGRPRTHTSSLFDTSSAFNVSIEKRVGTV